MTLGAFVLALVKGLMTFSIVVSGGSMMPTFEDGEVLYVSMYEVVAEEIDRGDIIAFELPGEDFLYVKRVIGLPGEEVSFMEGDVYVDGNKLSEPYARGETFGVSFVSDSEGVADESFVYNVPEGEYFVLGDNREESLDSRNYAGVYVRNEDLKGVFTVPGSF
jgi:signal peptidase I